MKTTVEIADDLARQARELAKRRDTTLRAILEEGIRKVLAADRAGEAYELPDRSVRGHGLQAEFRDRTWAEIREAAYDDYRA
jgi:hypothetical protein